MPNELKQESVKGVIWSGIDKIANGGVIFLANIILARLLTPKDFGLLAIIAIFVQISQTFIDSGFSNALIQKKNRSQTDYSTVFFFNLGLSIVFYIILFFASPLIANFFDNEKLTPLTRIVGLNLVIGALVSVHKTRLTIQLRFKIQAVISLIASISSATIAILLAAKGFGVWSLAILTISNITIQTILIYIFIKWKPSLEFSKKSFSQLFSYSSKLLGASLLHLLYRNIYPIVIGKQFSPRDLGFFNRADLFAQYIPNTVGSVISRVAFPIFSRIQDDNNKLRNAYSKYIVYSSCFIFPIMIGLIILAQPLIILILKEKWIPMIPMLQILCIDWMCDHLSQINLNVLFVKGRSDLALKLEIIKKITAILIFIISLKWGIIGVCWGRVIYGYFAIYLNSFYTYRLIGLTVFKQIKDILKPLFNALIMGAVIYVYIRVVNLSLLMIVCSSIIIGIIVYSCSLYLTDKKNVFEIKLLLINFLRNQNEKIK